MTILNQFEKHTSKHSTNYLAAEILGNYYLLGFRKWALTSKLYLSEFKQFTTTAELDKFISEVL